MEQGEFPTPQAKKAFIEGAHQYRMAHPDLAPAQRRCPECRKGSILPRERFCSDCRKKRRRQTMARAMQLQRQKNGSHV